MRVSRVLVLTGLLGMVGNACKDLTVTNLNEPDRERAIRTPADVEALISGAFYGWYLVYHRYHPNAALSVAADAHSSSWANWGMMDSSWEPRVAFDNEPEYAYSELSESPWRESYGSLTTVRDGLAAIADGVVIKEGGVDVTQRAIAFGKFVQAQSLANIAMLFDQGFIVDETSDLASLGIVPSGEVWSAALEKYSEVIQVASSNTFTIPAAWVGFNREWTQDDLVAFTKAYRARHTLNMARNQAERGAIDWDAVLSDLSEDLPFDFGTYDDGPNWGSHGQKLLACCSPLWARIDNRTIGPADVSGAWEVWINAPPEEKEPFNVVTPDSRITQPLQPTTDGKYIRYLGDSPFPVFRGVYHWSNYMYSEWEPYFDAGLVGYYPDLTQKEVDFIRAEAWFRTAQVDKAREIVNRYRANGDLPPFSAEINPDGPDSCVPQMPDGSCGGLWEAFKYEKRIELFHYGMAQEFFDDRGWGDLVEGTFLELPVPGSELLLLLMDIYSFGGNAGNGAPGGGVTPDFLVDISPEALGLKRHILEVRRGLGRKHEDRSEVVGKEEPHEEAQLAR
jgi:hypothetical protein